MRYGEVATKPISSAPISTVEHKPAIGDVHNGAESRNSVLISENNQAVQNNVIYPNYRYGFNRPDNKFTSVQATAWNHEYTNNTYLDQYGVTTSFGNIAGNIGRNGTEGLKKGIETQISNLAEAMIGIRNQESQQSDLEAKYPDYTFNKSQFGLLYTTPEGVTRPASELV